MDFRTPATSTQQSSWQWVGRSGRSQNARATRAAPRRAAARSGREPHEGGEADAAKRSVLGVPHGSATASDPGPRVQGDARPPRPQLRPRSQVRKRRSSPRTLYRRQGIGGGTDSSTEHGRAICRGGVETSDVTGIGRPRAFRRKPSPPGLNTVYRPRNSSWSRGIDMAVAKSTRLKTGRSGEGRQDIAASPASRQPATNPRQHHRRRMGRWARTAPTAMNPRGGTTLDT